MLSKIPLKYLVTSSILMCMLAIWLNKEYIKIFPGDLRNRVVGARLIEDGRSPYFYKWKPSDSLRYYDGSNIDGWRVSNMTGTPFLHQLFIPIANLTQLDIARTWFVAEHAILLLMGALAFRLSRSKVEKGCVLLLVPLMMMSYTFRHHLILGQVYLLIPLLLSGILYALKHTSAKSVIIAAFLTFIMVMIRPLAVLAILPLLFSLRNHLKYFTAFTLFAAAFLAFLFINPFQLGLYKDYRYHLDQQVKIHQGLHADTITKPGYAKLRYVEGFDTVGASAAVHKLAPTSKSENGNLFVIYTIITGNKLSIQAMIITGISSLILIGGLFYSRQRHVEKRVEQYLLLGFVWYMISELLSPIYRHQYYTVQFFFPLLLYASNLRLWPKKISSLVLIGFVLIVIPLKLLPMQYTTGEAIMLLAFTLAVIGNTKIRSALPGGL